MLPYILLQVFQQLVQVSPIPRSSRSLDPLAKLVASLMSATIGHIDPKRYFCVSVLDMHKHTLSKSISELRKIVVMPYLRINDSIAVELLFDSERQVATEHGYCIPHVIICRVVESDFDWVGLYYVD